MQVVITSNENVVLPTELRTAHKEVLQTKILWEFKDIQDAERAAVACVGAGFEFVYFNPTY